MPRRRLVLFAAACLLLAGPFFLHWAMTPAPGVTVENFRRLHAGMTLVEAEAILGRPADTTYCVLGPRRRWDSKQQKEVVDLPSVDSHYWKGESGNARIFSQGTLAHGEFYHPEGKQFNEVLAPFESTVAKIRRWLGL